MQLRKTLLLLADDGMASELQAELGKHGSVIRGKVSRVTAGKATTADCILIDLDALKELGKTTAEGLKQLRSIYPARPVVVLAGQGQRREAVDLLRAGADDYVSLPPNIPEILGVLESAMESMLAQSELAYLRDEVWDDEDTMIRGKSPGMHAVIAQLERVAGKRSTVLLTGESGTGKGVLARFLHRQSKRADGPFVAVHCGAIPENLVESELFGHERGAFTGAERQKLGKFEIAAGGTIFLDEIGTVSPSIQIKLLQVLQERTIQRVGGHEDISIDARVIAATNEDLKQRAKDGSFREDLFYRLNVFPVDVPPLRARTEDIPALARFFLARLNRHYGGGIESIDPGALNVLRSYEWPGNIRELENLIERAYILEDSQQLTASVFPLELFAESATPVFDGELPLADVRQAAADQAERAYLEQQLTQLRGSISRTAELAGITPRQLHKLMRKHGLAKEDYKG